MFNETNGARKNTPKTLIFMTDGQCNLPCRATGCPPCPPDRYINYKKRFKDSDIDIIGIGVGKNVNSTNINLLLDDGKYYPSLDFTQLTQKSFVHNLSVCDGMYITN